MIKFEHSCIRSLTRLADGHISSETLKRVLARTFNTYSNCLFVKFKKLITLESNLGRVTKIGDALKKAVTDSNVHEIVAELGDSALSENNVVTAVPVLGPLLSLVRAGSNVADNILAQKIKVFLVGINEVSANERKNAIDKIDSQKKYRQRVGEQLLFIIEKCDDDAKAEVIAWLFAHHIKSSCDYEIFRHASHVVLDVYLGDLEKFIEQGSFYSSRAVTEANIDNLANSSLFSRDSISVGMFNVTEVGNYILTALKGRKLKR